MDNRTYREFISYIATVYPKALLNAQAATRILVHKGQRLTEQQTETVAIIQGLTIPMLLNTLIDWHKNKDIMQCLGIALSFYPNKYDLKEYLQRHRKLEIIKEANTLLLSLA